MSNNKAGEVMKQAMERAERGDESEENAWEAFKARYPRLKLEREALEDLSEAELAALENAAKSEANMENGHTVMVDAHDLGELFMTLLTMRPFDTVRVGVGDGKLQVVQDDLQATLEFKESLPEAKGSLEKLRTFFGIEAITKLEPKSGDFIFVTVKDESPETREEFDRALSAVADHFSARGVTGLHVHVASIGLTMFRHVPTHKLVEELRSREGVKAITLLGADGPAESALTFRDDVLGER